MFLVVGYQKSERGGIVECVLKGGGRVGISGEALLVMDGTQCV